MKKKILALIVVALTLLTFAFTSCTTEEVSDVSMFEAYDVTKDFVDKALGTIKSFLNSKIEYTNEAKYKDASKSFLLFDERVNVNGQMVNKLSVKNIKTNEEIYSVICNYGTSTPSEISDAQIILGRNEYSVNDISEDYFIVTTVRNGSAEAPSDIITVEIRNVKNEKILSYKGTVESFEKENYVAKINGMSDIFEQKRPCSFQINDHIFFMNKLYRFEEAGLVLVKTFEDDKLFELDYRCFDYINGKYTCITESGEFYTFDKELSFERHKRVEIPVGYNYKLIGALSLDKVLYVLDKRVEQDKLMQDEVYDFILDGIAYTRDFYTYNLSTGATSKEEDILYRNYISVICKDYISKELDTEIDFGADVILTTDLELVDEKYYNRNYIQYTTNDSLYGFNRIDNEIMGFNNNYTDEVKIEGKLSTGNYVVTLPFGSIVVDTSKQKIGDLSGDIIVVTDDYIITENVIYSHSLEEKYKFANNESFYKMVGNTPIIVKKQTNKDTLYEESVYYSIGENEKIELCTTDEYTYDSIGFGTDFYRINKKVDEKYYATYYYENGEAFLEMESFNSSFDVKSERVGDEFILCYEKDGVYQYVYAYCEEK